MTEEFDPRKGKKLHWHEKEVKPMKVADPILIHKNPLGDMYYDGKDRKHSARDVDLPMRCFNIHISEIPAHKATRPHKHHNEAVLYIVKGKGHTILQGKRYDWEAGDFMYVPVMCWHSNVNDGDEPAYFMGITNKRLLNFLGLDRKIESGIDMTEEQMAKEIAADDYSPYSWYNIDPDEGVTFGEDHLK
jgi:mannose-6-phosphate isomerase-like protein (cupin superfamily)